MFRPGDDQPRSRRVQRVAIALIKEVRRRRATLPDGGSGGVFLANGSRLYPEVGLHLELSTPECMRPEELVRYARAGDRILAEAGEEVERKSKGSELHLFKTNVDYTSHQTWGSHESYFCRCNPRELAEAMIPHLVTRVIFTGAGGFRVGSPGLEFVISPRAFFLVAAISECSTDGRGIFNTRDEPLASGESRRMHLLCGESLCGEVGQYLRVGTTALTACMAEAKLHELADLELVDPVAAMYDVSRDPSLQMKVRIRDGRLLTALQMQRIYLQLAESHLGCDFMPDWASEVCRYWCEMLDALESDPGSVGAVLDWAIKLDLFRGHCRARGIDWELLPAFSEAAYSLASEPLSPPPNVCDEQAVAAWLDGPIPKYRSATKDHLDRHGFTWEQLLLFLAVREELFEIDRRFATLGSRSLFEKLAATGCLAHELDIGISADSAMDQPSSGPRAIIRGNAVRRLAGLGCECIVDWSRVIDYTNGRELRLGDPFATEARWTQLSTGDRLDESAPDDSRQRARRRMRAARSLLVG